MTKERKQKLSKASITALLKRHKKIKIVFKNPDDFDGRNPSVERMLTHKGTSLVRWSYVEDSGKKKWSRYETSCFCYDLRDGYYGNKKDKAKAIVDVMINYVVGRRGKLNKHIVAVMVGPGFKRKVV